LAYYHFHSSRPLSRLDWRNRHLIQLNDLNSFRPISNLIFLAKLIERIVANQFMEHADSSHLLPTRQSAYRRTYSTETAVTTVHNMI